MNIGWKKLDDYLGGTAGRESKIHSVVDERAARTLCGVAIPSDGSFDVDPGYGDGICKNCQKRAYILDGHAGADQNTRDDEQNEEAIREWLQSRPEVGRLNSGKFYVYPAGGEYKEISVFSK